MISNLQFHKVDIVNYALKKLVEQKEIEEILKLKGKIEWTGDLEEMRNFCMIIYQVQTPPINPDRYLQFVLYEPTRIGWNKNFYYR